jgi:hypothetical protein
MYGIGLGKDGLWLGRAMKHESALMELFTLHYVEHDARRSGLIVALGVVCRGIMGHGHYRRAIHCPILTPTFATFVYISGRGCCEESRHLDLMAILSQRLRLEMTRSRAHGVMVTIPRVYDGDYILCRRSSSLASGSAYLIALYFSFSFVSLSLSLSLSWPRRGTLLMAGDVNGQRGKLLSDLGASHRIGQTLG